MEMHEAAKPFSFPGTRDVGVLVIHGFTATPATVIEWAEGIHKKSGWTVEGPLLKGHGTRWQDLNNLSWRDWVDDVEKAYTSLSGKVTKVALAGISMGGTLATYLAAKHPETFALLLVNNLMLLSNPLLPLAPLIRRIIPSIPAIAGDIKDPNRNEVSYPVTPTGGVDEFRKLMNLVRRTLPSIKQPSLIFKARNDHVIPIKSATYTFKKLGSQQKELIWLENSFHVATLDFDLPLIVDKSVEFVRRFV